MEIHTFEFFIRTTNSSLAIDSFEIFFANSMDVYHELSEDLL